MKTIKLFLAIGMSALMLGCGDSSSTYSLLSDDETFHQNSTLQLTKIDVLFVVDNSGSMASSQQNLAENFPSFIQQFSAKNYDFQIGVTTTDAYLALPTWTSYYNQSPKPPYYNGQAQGEIAHLRNGHSGAPSGFSIINPDTPNLAQAFVLNAMQGINGRGDERSLQSFRTALDSPLNTLFRRSDAFLAVILVTDEDDFSHDGTNQYERYDRPLHTIDSYVSYLDLLTASSGATRRYSVSTISVNDQSCLDSIYNGAQKIGLRVGQMADATGGVKGNICGEFAEELAVISDSIVQLSTQFYLKGEPIPETIRVFVNNSEIPSVAANPDHDGGWIYNEAANSIMFQGVHIPAQNSTIKVTFDPKKLTF